VFAIDDLLALEDLSARERATRIFGLLRTFLDIPVESRSADQASRTAALALLTQAIEKHPDRARIHSALNEFWSHHSYVRVISEAGMPDEAFLLRELLARALRPLLPVDEVDGDLYVLMDSLDLKESDARWIGSLPDELVVEWADIFRPSRSSVVASCKILALRATNIALSRDMIEFSDDEDITKSSFFDLPSVVEHAARHPEDLARWEQQRAACEAQLQSVNRLLSEKGSSVDLIYRVRLLRSLLGRIQQVITLDQPGSGARKLSIAVVHGFATQRHIGTVLAASTRRLARSVVEKTGRTGIHYIARDAAQWRVMGMGAILAGVITSFTALFKYSLSAMLHAPLLVAFAHSMNYIVSFLLMQAGGFLLASKMPAATAAALVDAMEDPEKDHMASLRSISHTQFIVTIANLLGAVPVSMLIDRIFLRVTGHPFLTAAEADHGVHMLFPHTSGTIFFAILTGIFLWLSSLATGWTANYIAVHKMAAAISNSIRIRNRLGPALASRLAIWTRHHAAGSAGFIVLGILLGSMPIVFELFGIPLEVRHVTLAAAGLGYALDADSIYGHLDGQEAILAFSGIAFIGILNISTSFVLSFILAVRARNIADAQSHRFLREVGRELLTNPLAFLFPRTKAMDIADDK
jgi:site-specific recombinase